jgi:hypothetical protein
VVDRGAITTLPLDGHNMPLSGLRERMTPDTGRTESSPYSADGHDPNLQSRVRRHRVDASIFIEQHGDSRFDNVDELDARPVFNPSYL